MASADRWACDTSVAVAALDPTHEAHSACRRVIVEQRPALAGHAAFETYSVLTRRPPPLRITGAEAAGLLVEAFPEPCSLVHQPISSIFARLAEQAWSVVRCTTRWSASPRGTTAWSC